MGKEDGKKAIRAAIYSRISTLKQVERTDYDSLKSHLDRCKHYIQAQENWELVKVYEDPAESGDKWQREKLQEMLSDVKNGAIDVVVTFKLDRVSRSVRQFHEILKIFEENGVNLVAVTQGFDTSTPAGKLLRNILIDFAQFERDMISDRVKEKRLARAKKGLWNGGTPPYGYKTENRKLVTVPEEAEIIRRIFNVYKQTKSRTKVREELEIAGAKTRQGKPFSKGTIEAMLKNPVYAGKLFENEELFDGNHEPIIDADLFFALNQATPVSYHKKRVRKTDKVFLLKGLVKCATHDCMMTPYFIMKKNSPIHYYLCTKKRQYHKVDCPVGYANAEKLENYVLQRLKEVSGQEPVFKSIVDKVNLDLKSETLPYQQELEELNRRISEVSQQIENFVEAVASSGRKAIHDLLEKKVEKLQTDLVELNKRKSELAVIIASSPSKINAREVLQSLKDFSNLCENLSPEEKATYLRGIIQEVAVAEEDITIRLYCLPKPSLLTGSTNRLAWLPESMKHAESSLIRANY
jgi:site-specific DNA recombinase